MEYLHTHPYGHVIKYFVAGGIVLLVNLALLYILTDLLDIYYLYSSIASYTVAFCVSFLLQKYWTFRDFSHNTLHIQLPSYALMHVTSLLLNTMLIYLFVQYLHLWYLLSQVVISVGIAAGLFSINKLLIFRHATLSGKGKF